MNYYLDTEFYEYHKDILVGFRNVKIPTIDLISIGIVSDDNREYYALCSECDIDDAWNNKWLQDNVFRPIFDERRQNWLKDNHLPYGLDKFCKKTIKKIFNTFGFSRKEIANQIIQFVYPEKYIERAGFDVGWNFIPSDTLNYVKLAKDLCQNLDYPVFYGYYADYDWVVFAQLFGKMIDLPIGFPMYCRDLKQMKDERILEIKSLHGNGIGRLLGDKDVTNLSYEYNKTCESIRLELDELPSYPKQENEHNALADARWNRELFHWLMKIKPEFEKPSIENHGKWEKIAEEIDTYYEKTRQAGHTIATFAKSKEKSGVYNPVSGEIEPIEDRKFFALVPNNADVYATLLNVPMKNVITLETLQKLKGSRKPIVIDHTVFQMIMRGLSGELYGLREIIKDKDLKIKKLEDTIEHAKGILEHYC